MGAHTSKKCLRARARRLLLLVPSLLGVLRARLLLLRLGRVLRLVGRAWLASLASWRRERSLLAIVARIEDRLKGKFE